MHERPKLVGSIFGSLDKEEIVRDLLTSEEIAAELIASLGENKAVEVASEINRLLASDPDAALH